MLCALQPTAGIAASDDPNPHYRIALELLEQQRGRAAIFELRNALTLDPGHHKARLLLGKLRLGAGDPEGAERHLRLAMTASYSDETEALLGRALVDQLKFEEAIRTVSRDAGTAESKQDKLLVLADAYWGLEELDEVDGIYSQMLALWPESRDALLGKARLELAHHRRTTAARQTDELLEQHPDFGAAWVLRAELAVLENETDPALHALEQALRIDDHNIEAMIERARLNLRVGRWDDVDRDVEAAMRLQPKNPYVRYLSTALHFVQSEYIWADGEFSEVDQVLSEEPEILLLGSLIKFSLGDFSQSERLLSRYLFLQPRDAAARRILGLVLIERDNAVAAMNALEPLVEEHPEDSAALHLLATAYLQLGRHGPASRMLQRILEQGRGAAAEETARRGLVELAERAGIGGWSPSDEAPILPAGLSDEIFQVVDTLADGQMDVARTRVRDLKGPLSGQPVHAEPGRPRPV